MGFSRQEYWSGVPLPSPKVGLKLNIQKTKIMASGPITSWEMDGETVETVSGFIFLSSKITADGDCSHEIKRGLLLVRKVMTNLDGIFWRRQWHPTPLLLPGKSHGQRSLVGCSPWGRQESDTTSDFTFTFHLHTLEKEMAAHSSVIAWRIPGTGEPGGLPSMGSHRVGHD